MQATFVQEGRFIDYTPGAAVSAGDVVVLGQIVGVANVDIAANALGALAVDGVFDFAKTASGGVTFAVGDMAYWDDANNVAVRDSADGVNKPIGRAIAAAADADATVRARLEPGGSGSGGGLFAASVVVSTAQAAANGGDGRVDIDTGFGVQPTAVAVNVLTATTGVTKSGFVVSFPTAGTVRIDGVAAGVQIDENDIVHLIASL